MNLFKKIGNNINDNYETIKNYYFPFAIAIIGLTATSTLIAIGDKDIKTILTTIGVLITTSITVFFYYRKEKNKNLLTNLSLNFLLDDEFRFDYLLNVLIGKKPNKIPIGDSTDILFERIAYYSNKGDVEMVRRITETLPVLYYLSKAKYWNLVENLRDDYDPHRWKSDNRRRVIESFEYILLNSGFEKKILTYLEPRLNDETFTNIASIEILAKIFTLQGNKKRIAKQILSSYNKIVKSKLIDSKTKQLISKEWKLLCSTTKEFEKSRNGFLKFADSKDINEQIIAARNFRMLCKGSNKCFLKDKCKSDDPTFAIQFYNKFLEHDRHKNVRRPMAKEYSLECLVLLLQRKGFENMAKDIIWKLFKDEDNIIRITSFDKIYRIKEINHGFSDEIIEFLDKNDKDEKIRARIDFMTKYHY